VEDLALLRRGVEIKHLHNPYVLFLCETWHCDRYRIAIVPRLCPAHLV